jgi:lysophospholipase L1-like esterase
MGAIRAFAASHPDVLLVDAAASFDAYSDENIKRLFVDHAHLTREGNAVLAAEVWGALDRTGELECASVATRGIK